MKKRKVKDKSITFIVYGDAIPKARARVVRNKHTQKVHSFTPKTTIEWEASIYGQAIAKRPDEPWQGPIGLGVLFFKRIPKSWSKKKTIQALNGDIRPAGARDDLDNLIKAVKDAMKGIFWLDDGQVVEYISVSGLKTGKYYSSVPCVMISVKFIKDNNIKDNLYKLKSKI